MMQRMHSPWRSKYIASFSEASEGECILCKAPKGSGDENFIVTSGIHCYVIMNLYPYNSGHLMIVPLRHISSILEIMSLLKLMTKALAKVMHPDGFNIGSNISRSAGAGIDEHVHFHIVPRWNGDTNFMPVLADTKLISEDMKETLIKLRKAIE
jgi:ATP adenylyltransferase